MKNLAAVIRRDIVANRVVFITAAFAGVVPIVSLIARPAGWDRGAHISVMTGILSLAMAGGSALLVGSLMIGGELAERRLSFYFSRPVSPTSIWYGKVIAAILTAAAAGLIALIPSFFVPAGWKQAWPGSPSILAACIIAAVIPLILIAHAVSTALRSRSALVVLDLALATVSGTLLWLLLRPVINAMAWGMAIVEIGGAAVLLTICLVVAGQVQLSVGRCELRQSHAAFSRALWIGVGAVVLIAGLFTIWLMAPGPGGLDEGRVVAASRGPWAEVTGLSKARLDFPSISLVNTISGQIVRIPPVAGWWRERVKFSGDGQHAFWLEQEASGNWVVGQARLDGARAEKTKLRFQSPVSIQPSADGTRLATDDGFSIAVHDVESGRLLASFRVPPGPRTSWHLWSNLRFPNRDTVRFTTVWKDRGILDVQQELDVFEFNVSTRRVVQTGRFQIRAASMSIQPIAVDDSVLALTVFHSAAATEIFERYLIDSRTTAILRKFAAEPRPGNGDGSAPLPREPRMLSDGSLATLVPVGSGAALRIEKNGSARDFPLADGRPSLIGSEVAPGFVPIGMMMAPPGGRHESAHWDTVVIDIRTGSMVKRLAGRVPVSALDRWDFDTIPQPGSDGARLFSGRHLSLTRWAPGENERTVIAEK